MTRKTELKGLKNLENLLKNIDKNIDQTYKAWVEENIKIQRKELLKRLEQQHMKYLKSGPIDPVICAIYDEIMRNEKENE